MKLQIVGYEGETPRIFLNIKEDQVHEVLLLAELEIDDLKENNMGLDYEMILNITLYLEAWITHELKEYDWEIGFPPMI